MRREEEGDGGALTPEGSGSDEEWAVEESGLRGGVGGMGKGKGMQEEVNGEAVREGVRVWGRDMLVKTLVWGCGWGMMTVGLWGEGA